MARRKRRRQSLIVKIIFLPFTFLAWLNPFRGTSRSLNPKKELIRQIKHLKTTVQLSKIVEQLHLLDSKKDNKLLKKLFEDTAELARKVSRKNIDEISTAVIARHLVAISELRFEEEFRAIDGVSNGEYSQAPRKPKDIPQEQFEEPKQKPSKEEKSMIEILKQMENAGT